VKDIKIKSRRKLQNDGKEKVINFHNFHYAEKKRSPFIENSTFIGAHH
jgi:hypothetical protein